MSAATTSVIDLAQIVGPACVRDAAAADEIDGVRPSVVVEPPSADALAAVLAWCARERRSIVVRGGGTKLTWGRAPDRVEVLVSTRALTRITRYEPGDLTVTVEAGATVSDLNRELARHRQWLPIDLRGEASTVGGVVATNESGPLRHRYGAPRDVLIGVRLATADGRLASAGGNVVKNVAGYDLGRLVAGSFGSLAVIVSAAFKLSPIPAASTTSVLTFDRPDTIAGAAADIAASQLDPMAMDVEARVGRAGATYRLLVRMAGMAAPVDAETAALIRLATAWNPAAAAQASGDDETHLWQASADSTWHGKATTVKLSWLPADLAAVLAALDELVALGLEEVHLQGRAALGVGLLTLQGDAGRIADAVRVLRGRSTLVGNVVVVRAPAAVKGALDVWGVSEGTATVSRLLKKTLDPAGVLNAGRGPI